MLNVLQIQDRLKGFSEQQLAQAMRRPSGGMPQFLVLSELTRRKKMQQEAQAEQAGKQTTVAQDVMPAAGIPAATVGRVGQNIAPNTDMAQNTGVGSAPQRMAGGGIVALRKGGSVRRMQQGGTIRVIDGKQYYFDENNNNWGTIEDLQRVGTLTPQYPQSPAGGPVPSMDPAELFNLQARAAQQAAQYGFPAQTPMPAPTGDAAPRVPAAGAGVSRPPAPVRPVAPAGVPWQDQNVLPADFTAADLANLQLRANQQADQFGFAGIPAGLAAPATGAVPRVATYAPAPPQTGPAAQPRFPAPELPIDLTLSGDGVSDTASPAGAPAGQYGWQEALRNTLGGVHDVRLPTSLDDAMDIVHGRPRAPAPSGAVSGPAGMPVYPEGSAGAQPSVASQAWDMVSWLFGGGDGAVPADGQTRPQARPVTDAPATAPQSAPVASAPAASAPAGSGGAGGGASGLAALASSTTTEGSYGSELEELLAAREKRATQDKWLALAQAGMALMSSRAPTLGRALGEAGMVGIGALREGQSSAEADRLQMLSMLEDWNMQQRQLALAAARGGGGGGGSGGSSTPDWGLSTDQNRLIDVYLTQIGALSDQLNMATTPDERLRAQTQIDSLTAMVNTLAASGNPLYAAGISEVPTEPSTDLDLVGSEEAQ